jgi:hypothetical protein
MGLQTQLTEPGGEETHGDSLKAAGRAANRRPEPSPRRLAMAVEPISRPCREW